MWDMRSLCLKELRIEEAGYMKFSGHLEVHNGEEFLKTEILKYFRENT